MVLALIGCGNMGQAMVRGFLQKKLLSGQDIRLFDSDTDKTATLAAETGAVVCGSAAETVAMADVILLAVKPQVIEPAISSFAAQIPESAILVSIAAGVSLTRLRDLAGPKTPLARVMPNTPAMVGHGVSAVCYDRASHQQKKMVEDLLASCGIAYAVQEKLMDAVTGLSGSGPAYVMLMIEAMADAGVYEGLPRDMAIRMAAMTLMGSASLVLETGLHPAVLKDQVCSPGGTTIEAVKSLEESGLRAALMNAVISAAEKSKKLREMADGRG